MKRRARAVAVLVAVLAYPSLLWAQGALTPPGAPAPTMKTLAQIEPRTPISSLPFTITNSGSYYLAATLTGASGQSGITVQADNVTVDLEGFALIGAAGSLHGITAASGKQNLVVYNGILRGWGGNGLDAGGVLNCRVEDLLAASNGGHGLSVGANGAVKSCLALANSGDGVRVSSSCLVLNNACHTNGVGAGTAGIHATGTGNRIEANNLSGNLGSGIQVDGAANLVVKNSAAYSGGTDYNIAAGSSYGQLVQAPGFSFTNATAWANFSSSCPNGYSFCSGVCISLASNANNCGTCGNVCSFPNATSGCSNGICVLAACNAGYADCNNNPADGCEVHTATDLNNCGSCGLICNLAHATAGCSGGGCIIASCNAGYANCDNNPANGCEVNTATDPNNCGSCGNFCNLAHATSSCSGGACILVSCTAGFANCDGNPANGCEVSTVTDLNNCGGCGVVCNLAHASSICSAGACSVGSCNAGFANCNGLSADGCEVNITNDPNNCGGCGVACGTVPNGNSGCAASACVILSCNAGFADCDGNRADGCEINTTSDNNHCGNCSTVCNGTTQQCTGSVCKLKSGQPCSSGSQCVSGVCNGSNLCS